MQLLPEPDWVDADSRCVACGYSLAGLTPPTKCPECGLPYSGRQFLAYGIASARSTMSPMRIAIVIVLCVIAMFSVQLLFFMAIALPWWATLSVILIGLVLLVWFIVSSPRSHGGTARIVFDHAGVTVVPLVYKQKDGVGDGKGRSELTVCLFSGSEGVEFQQVSDTWAKFRIRKADGSTLFAGGIQSPIAKREFVVQTLRWIIRGAANGEISRPPPLPGAEPGTFSPVVHDR